MKRILKAVTTKYMMIFTALIALTIFVLGTMIATILSNYSIDVSMENLSTTNILFKKYYNSTEKEDSALEKSFKDSNDELKETLQTTFLVMESCQIITADKNGKVVMHSYKNPSSNEPVIHYFSDGYPQVSLLKTTTLPAKTLQDIKNDGDISMNNSCNGLFKEKVIWFASALENEKGETEGYVISFTRINKENDLFIKMVRSISLTAMWLLVVAIIAVYVISYKVMTPLREISNAAKSFARGHFDVRVPERGNDELTELARSINKMAVEIQSKDEMQKQFLSNASHDLRTPMTTIAGFIDGILDGAIPKEKHEYYLNIIKNEVQRLSRLVTSLLDISRLQSGERKFDKKPFNVCELSRQTVISFENQFNEKMLDVEFETEKYDMIAIGDKDAINQVIYNLCHNAIKFSYEKGKYKVNIRYVDDDKIEFSVYNEGIGISREEVPFVFDRFYKSDKSRGLDKTGVGLGLFISKTIVDAHDGDMWVESEYEKWCKFSFTLKKGEKVGN